jgi:hypothetical protein
VVAVVVTLAVVLVVTGELDVVATLWRGGVAAQPARAPAPMSRQMKGRALRARFTAWSPSHGDRTNEDRANEC